MDFSSYETDSTNVYSDISINSNNELTNSNTELINISNNESKTENNTEKSFKLNDEKSSIYIIKEERQMLVQCTSCSYSKTVKVRRFQSSNFAKHYKIKHLHIAYNKKSEKTREKKNQITENPRSFFNLQTRKRPRNNTIFNTNVEKIINNKILNFIINNDLSFNILNSESFQDLILFFKPFDFSNCIISF
ncbi:hypothetical protein GGR58DRAFT_519093 [Xylaria digitata]|nr:hypothetical protein GGR58DRAFT_519093 [Xylaria digitata]